MAKKRMFANDIINSEGFYALSNDAKLAYLYLNLGADDDGFVATATKELFPISIDTGSALDELVRKGYLIKFDSPRVYVITHFFVHNVMRKDRYTQTYYTDLKSKLSIDKNGKYILHENDVTIDIEQLSVLVATNKIKENKSKSNEDVCTEPGKPSGSALADVDGIPCLDGTLWYPTKEMYERYIALYPAVDIEREFKKMVVWCEANPKKKKTVRGCARFVANWLERAQNRGGWGQFSRDPKPQAQKISYVESAKKAEEQTTIDEEEEVRKTMEELARIRRREET